MMASRAQVMSVGESGGLKTPSRIAPLGRMVSVSELRTEKLTPNELTCRS